MSCFDWSPELETGYKVVDDQHKQLFALANALQGCALAPARDADAVGEAVYGLTDYVIEHFTAEEALMRLFEYPEVGLHKMLHDQLTSDVLSLAARYFNGEDVPAEAVSTFVAEWLREHIGSQDMRAVKHIRAHRAGLE